jgi:hypothetical protein
MNNEPLSRSVKPICHLTFFSFLYILLSKGVVSAELFVTFRGPVSTSMTAQRVVWRGSHLVTDETFHVNA